jgi:hypothetical protein
MAAYFPHFIRLKNVLFVKGALNPWETHEFLYPHFAVPDSMTCILDYTLEGDIPEGIKVDRAGNIYGTIKWFGEQPSCQDNWGIKENDIGGLQFSGWPNQEIPTRFRHMAYMFRFNIIVSWKEKKWHEAVENSEGLEEPGYWEPCRIRGTTTQCCELLVVKNHDICNQIWLSYYTSKYKLGDYANPGPLLTV